MMRNCDFTVAVVAAGALLLGITAAQAAEYVFQSVARMRVVLCEGHHRIQVNGDRPLHRRRIDDVMIRNLTTDPANPASTRLRSLASIFVVLLRS
jgi:hypothetical protein